MPCTCNTRLLPYRKLFHQSRNWTKTLITYVIKQSYRTQLWLNVPRWKMCTQDWCRHSRLKYRCLQTCRQPENENKLAKIWKASVRYRLKHCTVWKRSRRCCASATWHAHPAARRPCDVRAVTASSTFFCLRLLITTAAPSFARRSAIAKPMLTKQKQWLAIISYVNKEIAVSLPLGWGSHYSYFSFQSFHLYLKCHR